MPYEKVKIYSDGSHYIGIPHTTRPKKDRIERKEDKITVIENDNTNSEEGKPQFELVESNENDPFSLEIDATVEELSDSKNESNSASNEVGLQAKTTQNVKRITRKEIFEELYVKYSNLKKKVKKKKILEEMKHLFKFEELAEKYVQEQFERKERNLICRRVRMNRKINLQKFNYFVTFTYDGKKITEKSFRDKLMRDLSKRCKDYDWKYVGVWERSPGKNRLHFHALMSIPEGTMAAGGLKPITGYSIRLGRMETINMNPYFFEMYGRNDFEDVFDRQGLGEAIAYISKYIEKSGERIVYSKNLPEYFISDIWEEDVVCNIGLEDRKLLLFDDFTCWDEGVYIGVVSPEVIAQMPKANS